MQFLLAFLLIAVLSASNPPIGTGCSCYNGGLCNTQQEIPYCDCPYPFLDSTCDKEGIQLLQDQLAANLTSSTSYFFISFNQSTLLYVQIFLCPVSAHPDTLFFAYIDFEKEDGSISAHKKEAEHAFKMKDKQCVVAKYVIFPSLAKRDGELIRLIMQLKTSNPNPNASVQTSQVSISYILYEFYKMDSQNQAQFLIISTVSSALLFCITFTICRRIMQRRMRRFISQPATPVLSISSFETTMPSKFYPADQTVNQQDKECMICLLNVENTMARTTPCSHLFHKDCIDQWGRKSLTCPTCRTSLHPLMS